MPTKGTIIVLSATAITIAIYHAATNPLKLPSDFRDAPVNEQVEKERFESDAGNFTGQSDDARIPLPAAPQKQEERDVVLDTTKLPYDMINYLKLPVPAKIEPVSESIKTSECDEEKRLFSDGLKSLLPDNEIYNKLSSRQPDVWLIGEIHEAGTSFQTRVVREIKATAPRVDCFFAEYVPGLEYQWDMKDPSKDYWKVAKAARDLGLSILFVDPFKHAYTRNYTQGFYQLSQKKQSYHIYVRNKGMADEIEKSFVSGQCHGGIYVVGKAHLYSSWENFRIIPIGGFLQQLNRRSVSINLIPTNYRSNQDGSPPGDEFTGSKDSCRPPVPKKSGEPTGFIHGAMPTKSHLYDAGGSMNDFDATIFY